jgi:hypothetical protein
VPYFKFCPTTKEPKNRSWLPCSFLSKVLNEFVAINALANALHSVRSCDSNNDNLWRSFRLVAFRVRVLQAATERFPLLLSHTLTLMIIRLKGVCIFQKGDNTQTYTYVTPIICRLDMSKVYEYHGRTGVLHFYSDCTHSCWSALEQCTMGQLAV